MNPNLQQKISVLIITLNEAVHMKPLLDDLKFADEVIIVDSYSTDETKSIATSYENVKFIENKFENYTSQRNFAIDQARNKWILFIDADERLTPELKLEILEIIQNQPAFSAYLVYRTFMFNNKVLHFSGWQTDRIYRLFNKEKARYANERLVHEKLDVKGEITFLKNKLIHYSYNDYDVYKGKMINYGKLKAIEAKNKGIKPNAFHFYIKPAYKFLYQYLIRLGILDGTKGITICYLNALSVYVRFQELKKLNSRV